MSEEGAYMVFCTELYRREKNLTGKQVADLFSRYHVYDYIRKYFGVFHTGAPRDLCSHPTFPA